jgi:formate hydrogenlyase transcriptional activator
VERYARQFGKQITGIAQDTMDLLSQYDWPGNIRELQNVVERAVVLSRGPILRLGTDLLPATGVVTTSGTEIAVVELDPHKSQETVGAVSSLEQVERSHIRSVLQKADWVIEGERGAAKILDLHPNTLRSRMKKLGIERAPTNSAPSATKSRSHEVTTN